MDIYSQVPEYVKKTKILDKPIPLNQYTKNFAKDYVLSNLPQNTNKESAYSSKVERKVLVIEKDKFSDSVSSKKRKLPKQVKSISSRKQKDLKIYDLAPANANYSSFEPLNKLWEEYMGRLLSGSDAGKASQSVLKADYHGSIITGELVSTIY
ncbi:hypothetical protein BB559_001482 [Furculomyces boomerangus]|uniref:Uncharacterized protein n=1 Tax=Furculomyces boomerangus TaxID=61424 RepID=A0A2T9Z1R9_9FUNG|nr:hypothetical protein BB559_001482 [Furculomyces boomerangus]